MAIPVITPTSDSPRLRRQALSYEEYLALPDESRIIEWVNGEAIFHIPPTPAHQIISSFIEKLLGYYVDLLGLGLVLDAPVEVKLWPGGPSREPDLLYITNEKLPMIGEKQIEGTPDLIVEIVSPASITLDRITKFREYEQAGVGEYWIIDPRPHQQQADFYARDEEGHFIPAPVDKDGVYTSRVVRGFRLRVAWLWQLPLPNPRHALAEITADAAAQSDELRALYREMARGFGES